jgi:peptidoglycan DL-endopeptidase CwlO
VEELVGLRALLERDQPAALVGRRQLGVSLPHNALAQYGYGTPVPSNALEPGDLVFFDGLGHVGIYVGNGAFIHAPHTGDVVKISSLTGWYSDNYVGARRVA